MKNSLFSYLILLPILSLCTISCRTVKPIKIPDPTPIVKAATKLAGESAKTLKTASGEVTASVTIIKTEAQTLEDTIPAEVAPSTTPHLRKITSEADSIAINADRVDQVSKALTAMKEQLEESQVSISAQEKMILKLTEERDKAIEQRDSALQKSLMYLVLLGVVLIGLSGVLIYNGNGKAVSIGVGGFLLIVISLAISFFIKYLAIIGIVFSGVIFLVIAYELYKKQKAHSKAFNEVVHTSEIVKQKLSDADRVQIFGDKVAPGAVEMIQSPETKEMVQASRKKQNAAWSPTVGPDAPKE
jgi:hypothetical protein